MVSYPPPHTHTHIPHPPMLVIHINEKRIMLLMVTRPNVSFAVNWLDHSRTFREQGVEESEILLLRRKFFYSDQNVDSRDPVQLNLLYVQVKDHFCPSLFLLFFYFSLSIYILCQVLTKKNKIKINSANQIIFDVKFRQGKASFNFFIFTPMFLTNEISLWAELEFFSFDLNVLHGRLWIIWYNII